MRTRNQRCCIPFTGIDLTAEGRVKRTVPPVVKALVLSSKSDDCLGLDSRGLDEPSSIHTPSAVNTSQVSCASSSGIGVSWVRITVKVMVGPEFESASSMASQKLSLNLGFSPNG